MKKRWTVFVAIWAIGILLTVVTRSALGLVLALILSAGYAWTTEMG